MTLETVTRVEAHCDAPGGCGAVREVPRGQYLRAILEAAGWTMVRTPDDKLMHYCPDHQPAKGCTCAVGHEEPPDLVPDCAVHRRRTNP